MCWLDKLAGKERCVRYCIVDVDEFGMCTCMIYRILSIICDIYVALCALSNHLSNSGRHKRMLVLCKCLARSVSNCHTSRQYGTHHRISNMDQHIHMQSTSSKGPLVLSVPLLPSQHHQNIHLAHPNKAAIDLRNSSKQLACVTECNLKQYSLPTVAFYQTSYRK